MSNVIDPYRFAYTPPSVNLLTDLTAVWEFNNDLTDSHGSYDGEGAYGTSYDNSGKWSKYVIQGDGSDSYADVDIGTSGINDVDSFMVGFWIYARTPFAGGWAAARYNASANNRVWLIGYHNTNGVYFQTYDSGQTVKQLFEDTATPYETGWKHIFVVRDGSNEYIYVNGVETASWSTGHATLNVSSVADFRVFASESSTNPSFYGDMQQLAWWGSYRSDHADMANKLHYNGAGLDYSSW